MKVKSAITRTKHVKRKTYNLKRKTSNSPIFS